MSLLSHEQDKDPSSQNALQDSNTNYIRKEVRGGSKRHKVVFCNDKAVVTRSLRKRLIDLNHTTLMHRGINRTEQTMAKAS